MAERRSFGQALKGYRKALGLTQKELAHTAGCAVVTLRKLEADSLRCSLPLAQRLAMALGLSAEEQPAFLQSARIAGHAARAALPIPPTTWVGRSADLGAVAALLEKPGVRLLTLTGPPGVGKTRLALHVAAALEERYTDGVACVALADLDDSQRVVSAIAQACGVAERNGQTLPERLKRALHARHMLLVLDNFEHLRPAAPLLVELLEAIPGLRLLVTSRAALRVSGEYEYEVQPLPVPPPEPAPTPADLLPIPSVELLVERGQAVRATFRLTGQNAAAIAELCRRLDGLPLALELAAARLKLLTPQQLLDQFEGSLALLTSGPQDLPPRQQTLRQAIAWSYALLDPAAQRLFRQLGVFVGGWSLAAAQAVVEAAYSALSLLHAVTILLDQSLVQRQDTPDGSPHFTMLETLRHYALEQLASHAETETAARRHASYYLSLAEEAAPQLRLAAGVAHLDTLQHEHANLRAALRWSLGNDHVLGLRLATAIYRFWSIRGYQTEGQEWLRLLLAHD
ncbi:MAG: AAA family ATPase, partial [Chloroflexaceae bacterium]|nr:AAA family ATPase [Chloroflexaceae bacterium]